VARASIGCGSGTAVTYERGSGVAAANKERGKPEARNGPARTPAVQGVQRSERVASGTLARPAVEMKPSRQWRAMPPRARRVEGVGGWG
jgi:hypothetical protein